MTGQILCDRYQILNVLGAGGMGQTYVAEDTQRPGNPKCVVKQLKPISNDPNFLATASRLFAVEAETLEKLGKHDQIPQLFAHFERDGEFYVVQEFIDGQVLRAELPLGQRWSEAQVVALLADILGILEFIHSQGVIHRDIKPDNIMRRKHDSKLVLIDFGAVKQVRMQQATEVGQVSVTVAIGTPGYMPTEQSSGKPRPSSDIYALGMVAIQSLTGLLPSQLREDEDGEVVWRDQAEVGDGLAQVLTTMTRHYFKHRYQSAAEVLQVLKDLESSNFAAVNRGYTPTQSASNGGYTPTVDNRKTQTGFNQQIDSSQPKSSRTQTQKVEQRTNLNGQNHTVFHDKSSESLANKLLMAGSVLLSLLIAGGLIFQKLSPSPSAINSDLEPTKIAAPAAPKPSSEPIISTSPAAVNSDLEPTKVAAPVAPKPSSERIPTTASVTKNTSLETEAETKRQQAAAEAQRQANANAETKRQQAAAEAQRQANANAETKRQQAAAEAQRQANASAEAKRQQAAADAQRQANANAEAKRQQAAADAQRQANANAETKRQRIQNTSYHLTAITTKRTLIKDSTRKCKEEDEYQYKCACLLPEGTEINLSTAPVRSPPSYFVIQYQGTIKALKYDKSSSSWPGTEFVDCNITTPLIIRTDVGFSPKNS